ncbi:MAG: hypothetical protein V4721_12980 [Bacteroidota bacterium]
MKTNHQILYDCKNATFLLEKKSDVRLSVKESFELNLHLASCSICRLYQFQTARISVMIKQILSNREINQLDKQFKAELQECINTKQKNNK